MRSTILLSILVAASSGCKSIDCGEGTIERNGTCAPATVTTDPASCGAGTMLDGDRCVPVLPPTMCDPTTTTEMPDPTDPTITICVGMGGTAGCGTPLSCGTPAAGKQNICGQIYDAKTDMPFQATGATGAKCTTATTTGPCALSVTPYDAFAFAASPSTATPLTNSGVYIDDCGRYRITDIAQPGSPFIGLGFDDVNAANMGPNGVTNTVGVATAAAPDTATSDLEGYVVDKTTTDGWTSSGGPPVSGGVYAAIFRTHKCPATGPCTDRTYQAGVTITKMGSTLPNNDYYFTASETTRTTIDAAATVTGMNGTGLLTGALVSDGLVYSGTGGITDTTNCKWESKAAASLANIVFFQVYRPMNQVGKQCNQ